MTLAEEKKVRFELAKLERVKPNSVLIFSIEEQADGKRKVYASVKGVRIGALVHNVMVLYVWRVVN